MAQPAEPQVKLGGAPPRHDPRTLYFADLRKPGLAPPPPHCNWMAAQTKPVQFGMFGNDRAGCCTEAAKANMIRLWNWADQNRLAPITDADVLAEYARATGYDPATGANDTGEVEIDSLNRWRRHGIGGHRIEAYVKVDHANDLEVRTAISLFGGVYIGVGLPLTAQAETGPGKEWRARNGYRGERASWGWHALPIFAYSQTAYAGATWGAGQRMTVAFWRKYVAECYAVLPALDWTGPDGINPIGMDVRALRDALATLRE